MNVVGGTYIERCRYPSVDRIMGSGARAACALSGLSNSVRFYSAIDPDTRESAGVTLGGFTLSSNWVERNERIQFDYFTPLSSPSITGRMAHSDELHVKGEETVLSFGMIETSSIIKANHLIFDPQQPRDLVGLDLSKVKSNKLALVANKTETIALGEDLVVNRAAQNLLKKYNADVVITKQGARGALVTTSSYQKEVGAFPTKYVMPIGSGDTFAAGFAWAWGEKHYDPVESANVGSAAAASYVSTGLLPIEENVLIKKEGLAQQLEPKDTKVYLAGPFFCLSEQWLIDLIFGVFHGLGASVFSPYHEVGMGGDEVAVKDLDGLAKCDSVLAILDNYDPGTIFEAGWAVKMGKPVVGFVSDISNGALKMLRGSGVELYDDLSTAVYRSAWLGMGAKDR